MLAIAFACMEIISPRILARDAEGQNSKAPDSASATFQRCHASAKTIIYKSRGIYACLSPGDIVIICCFSATTSHGQARIDPSTYRRATLRINTPRATASPTAAPTAALVAMTLSGLLLDRSLAGGQQLTSAHRVSRCCRWARSSDCCFASACTQQLQLSAFVCIKCMGC